MFRLLIEYSNRFRSDYIKKFDQRARKNSLLQISVHFHLGRIEPATDPDQPEDENLLEKECQRDPYKGGLRDDSLDQYIDQGEQYLDEEHEVKKTESGAEMPENESESARRGCQDIRAVFYNDPDTSIIEDHLDKQEKKQNDSIKYQSQIKRGDLGKSRIFHAI